jgi:hypothetical protein
MTSEFANFVASNTGCGGSGSGFTGALDPSLILPPQNISLTGGGYGPPPPAIVPYVAPPPSSANPFINPFTDPSVIGTGLNPKLDPYSG